MVNREKEALNAEIAREHLKQCKSATKACVKGLVESKEYKDFLFVAAKQSPAEVKKTLLQALQICNDSKPVKASSSASRYPKRQNTSSGFQLPRKRED